jgi:glucokinase
MKQLKNKSPSLLADIGGTNARFALFDRTTKTISQQMTLFTGNFPDLASAAKSYLTLVDCELVQDACIAIANPMNGDTLKMTNSQWEFSIEETRKRLGLEKLVMLNDWEAVAMAIPAISQDQLEQIGGGEIVLNAPKGLIGPGTGLGVSSLVLSPSGDWVSIAGEGGHVTLSPSCDREVDILRQIWLKHSHVSAEQVISGKGLENLYIAICQINDTEPQPLKAAEITQRAIAKNDVACEEALDRLCSMLGTIAGNLALMLGAKGGIYIGGGIVSRLGTYFANSSFRSAFEAKGRFENYMRRIPTYVIRAEYPGLIGCAIRLNIKTKNNLNLAPTPVL